MSAKRIAHLATTAFAALVCCIVLASCVEMTSPYGGGTTSAGTGQTLEDLVDSGLTMQTEKGTETLDIRRMSPGGKRPDSIQKGTWTVFVYLCGSNLESQGGSATKDLSEMLTASGSNKVRFVVQTGGARSWRNNTVSPRKHGRYLIQQGKIAEVGSEPAQPMGVSKTLADFLTWGVKNYPADHMGLIMWDHGGGSISGVCFDEQANNDSLYLRELDSALATTYKSMWDKFEFVGFDACLMSTLETANVLASYSKYMIASQESEPANGWEYKTIVNALADKPDIGGEELGKTICNSYLASIDRSSKGFATLSVIDLSQIDQLMQDFYRFSQEMYASSEDQKILAAMSRGIQKADNYGCNNRREGYTNMVDLGGLVDACASVAPSAKDVKDTLHKAVKYQIRGTYHAAATGLSTYYPLRVNTKDELSVFNTVAVNPSYLTFVDRLATGATYNGGSQYQGYNSDTFFEDNIWNWLLGNTQQVQQQVEDHWNYVDDHSETSTQISFADKPQVDDEGTYWFKLDKNGLENAAVVSGIVYELSADQSDLISLGETYDIYANWDNGEFSDAFDGKWLSLPDGQNLNLSVQSATDDYIIYTSPIKLNKTECYLRLVQNIKDGSVIVEGAWNGLDESGAIDRGVTKIKEGDFIIPTYKAFSADENVRENTYEGNPYRVEGKELTVKYGPLPKGTYLMGFCIEDVFGDCHFTEHTQFNIDEKGTIYY